MKKLEFLKKLRDALSQEMDAYSVKNQVSYYSHYIDAEVAKGRSEGDVVDELGDPWLIARTILDAPGETYQMPESGAYTEEDEETVQSGRVHSFSVDSWWKRILFWIVVCAVFVIIGVIIWGAAVISIKYILPVMLVVWLVRLIVTAISGR